MGLAGVIGQDRAVRALRLAARQPAHAYLLVGPPGTGKLAAAKAFAAMLLCPAGGDDGCGTCRRVAEGKHPDLVLVEREGAALSIEQAREVTRVAARSSLEGGRSVVVLPDLHLAGDAIPALLKTVEEPAGDVVFVALAEYVPPELATIASRCARVDFRPLSEDEVIDVLVSEGIAVERAAMASTLAAGRLDRARLLASDPGADARRSAWVSIPGRLDGTGATIARLVDELIELLKKSAEPLAARQAAEVAALAESMAAERPAARARTGARTAARAAARDTEERHRREQRRQRSDELRTGLAALARAYRDRGAAGTLSLSAVAEAVGLIDRLSADLAYNPGEQLATQALFVRLDRLGAR